MKRFAIALSIFAISSASAAFEPTEDGLYARFETSLGEFTAKLAYDGVPLTTANFVGLAEGTIPRFSNATGEPVVAGPYYDGQIFHRVIDGFVVQAGDPLPDDDEINGPGYRIPDEMHPSLTHQIPYVIAMANNYSFGLEANYQFWDIGENTGGSQFYITIAPPENVGAPDYLDGHFSIFGVIEDGTDILETLGDVPVDPETSRPLTDVVINSVTIIRVGEAAKAWNVRDYELPTSTSVVSSAILAETETGPAFQFPASDGKDFIVRKSTDLENWNYEVLNAPDQGASQLAIEFDDAEKQFLQIDEIRNPMPYSDRIPGATFVATMSNHPLSTAPWTFAFNEEDVDAVPNGYGTVSIPNINDAVLLRYEYHRLPNGARLRVSTESQQVMTYYLRYTSENSGGFIVWVDDYLHGSTNPSTGAFEPLRFPTTGTFELTLP